MENLSLFVLNGRTSGDLPGKYTFLNALGKSTNLLNETISFKVFYPETPSDHSVCTVTMEEGSTEINSNYKNNESNTQSSHHTTFVFNCKA